MNQYEKNIVDRIAGAIRRGDAAETRRLLTEHPECNFFLELPGLVTTGIESWMDFADQHGQEEVATLLCRELPDLGWSGVNAAISSGDVRRLRWFFAEHPQYVERWPGGIGGMLRSAAHHDQIEVAKMLLEMGVNINDAQMPEESTALSSAISFAGPEMAQFLLSRGADPNIGRPIIGAINRDPEELGLKLVQLLVEHGADVNQTFLWFNDPDVAFTPLEWAQDKPSIAAYLRSKGAVEREKKLQENAALKTLADEVVAYFDEHFGPPRPQAQIEIVPSGPPIAVHVIPAADGRTHVTFFTTGMSEHPMQAPEGIDDHRFAEIFIQLPADWPTDQKALATEQHGWPLRWLRSIAQYPHQNQTWLGGPVTIIANDDPPRPLAPGLMFTSVLLMANQSFTSRDGRTIYLYRMMPLYTEERVLELNDGIAALMRAFDKLEISSVVDLNRPNVALQS